MQPAEERMRPDASDPLNRRENDASLSNDQCVLTSL